MLKDWLEGLSYVLVQGSLDCEPDEVVYDSRKAKPGAVFVCMVGSRVDSHSFIPQVLEAGVRVLVVEREVAAPEGVTIVRVADGREALAVLSAARFGHPARKLRMFGVTGTKGKTTTTHMLKAILEASGEKVGMIGTNGIFIGGEHFPTVNTTPESYDLHRYFARMYKEGCSACVMEVSSQAFKLRRVAGIVYDYAIFTNISRDHIGPDEHTDFAEYLHFKKQIFAQSRHVLVNMDDPHIGEITKDIGTACDWDGFSLDAPLSYRAEEIRFVSEPDFVGVEFSLRWTGKAQGTGEGAAAYRAKIPIRVSIPGKFNVYNALSAAATCLCAGVPSEKIQHALEHIKIDGRMEIVFASEKFCVIVDYAHNAVSMESLLETLRDYHPKRLVCVFGCGGNRSKDRRYAMGEIAGKMADFSILTADNSRFEKVEDIIADIRGSILKTGGRFIEIPDRREAILYSIRHALKGDMIAVIGKGHEDYQEINGVRHHFLDREVIEEALTLYGEK